MQRFLTLVFLLCLSIPAGISISGCTRNPAGNYCNGDGYGLKLTQVASIDLEPRTTGISLAFGQIATLASPTAKNCKGTAASVAGYTYGTTNNQLLDLSPTGSICAGTWNRRSGGGIPDYTTCTAPNPLPVTNGYPYGTAYVSATAQSVSSNQVQVFVHAQVTGVALVLENSATDPTPIVGCLSQTQTAILDSQEYYTQIVNGVPTQELLCGPTPTASNPTLPSCSVAVGSLTYTSQTTTVATIDQFGTITALQPGTTYITASVAGGGSGSTQGYFSTCPPASIQVSLNGATSGTVTQGVTQSLTTTILDTKGQVIQGLALDYQSTNPLDISVGSTGAITANFAGEASIYAVCQPTTCNPSPIDKVGVNQTGVPVTSNAVTITTPGIASDYVWMSSPMSPAFAGATPIPGLAPSAGSQYFVPVELISGTVGAAVKMPYVPNSMVMDRTGTSLYFGSTNELMVYTTATNALSKEDPNVPGIVLAASPDNQTILINDQKLKRLYLYKPASGAFTQQPGIATSAQWSPDAKTMYAVGTDVTGAPTLFVNNVNTGWTTYKLTAASSDLTMTVPGIGAFLSGNPTVAHAWCPEVAPDTNSGTTLVQAYPLAATVQVPTDILAATTDGAHILGATLGAANAPSLYDIHLDFSNSLVTGACPAVASGGTFTSTNITVSPVTANPNVAIAIPAQVQVSEIDQVVPSPASNLAFVTYAAKTGSTGTANLPYYEPAATGTAAGPVNYVTLTGAPTAPLAGVFSLDDTLFFVSTSGDNLVHYIDVKTLTDTQQIKPGLVDLNGNPLPATAIAAKPRATT